MPGTRRESFFLESRKFVLLSYVSVSGMSSSSSSSLLFGARTPFPPEYEIHSCWRETEKRERRSKEKLEIPLCYWGGWLYYIVCSSSILCMKVSKLLGVL